MDQKYYIGLDMGVASLGWAVTDTSYHLLRAKGKDLWGVRLFDEAKGAEERRMNRTARRNRQRKKAREGVLRELFSEEIEKIDPGFFQRLQESKYYLEDRESHTPYTLFADDGGNGAKYTDREYYEKYPTIFHLICDLIRNPQPHDVRLVYLACLNIFKHRGNFLNENLDGNGVGDIRNLCESFVDTWNMLSEDKENFEPIDTEKLSEVLGEILPTRDRSNTAKQKLICEKMGIKKNQRSLTNMINLICGLKGTLCVIFDQNEYEAEYKDWKLSFKDGDLDEKLQTAEGLIKEEEYELLLILKSMHDWGAVAAVMKGYEYLSESRVASYNKHHEDLALLKKIYREYLREKYDEMFRKMIKGNYCSYIGKASSDKKSQTEDKKVRMKRRGEKKCTKEELYKVIKADLKKIPDCEEKRLIEKEIENDNFLPKQLTNENGKIPYQLHAAELKKILENAANYLPFLNHVDESGYSVKDKIVMLFEFRVPYYVGPVFQDGSANSHAWVVRKDGGYGRVYPWNFTDKIDEKASAEEFIKRMLNHCTYLNDETALPKESLKYERFRVLNELNNLMINGQRVSTKVKQLIYNKLFKCSKKVTQKKVIDLLRLEGLIGENVAIGGIDGDFKNVLSSYRKFKELFDTETLTDEQEKTAEDIIMWATVYGDSKKFLEERIREAYGPDSEHPMLSEEQLKRVRGYKFKDWGRLSKEFLDLEGADRDTGEITSLIHRMWDENYNLTELLSDRFTYRELVEERCHVVEKTLSEIEYEDLENLYISAPVKRMTWQTILVLKELYEVIGYPPEKIFIEMAREHEQTEGDKRKKSRKNRLLELYENCKKECEELYASLNSHSEQELRSKKLYLYYTQKGRCMYSGEIINYETLYTDDYDIDHIYPQSVVSDDSLNNNMVLVKRDYNNRKSDNYPLNRDWQKKNYLLWKMLREEEFITAEKYKRLTRTEKFSEDELAGFVNRQIVETRQGTKAIADLLKETFRGQTEIVYSKAGNVSAFRHQFAEKYDKETETSTIIAPELMKCRLVNDFHHAHDAYLNIVVGNVYNVKFTKDPKKYIKEKIKEEEEANKTPEEEKKKEKIEKYHMKKIFWFNVERNGYVAWNRTGEEKSLYIVKNTLKRNTPLVTKMSYDRKGKLAEATIYSAKMAAEKGGVGYLPVKSSDKILDVKKYGGFTSYTGAYFFLVEHTLKKKRVRTIETMPLYMADQLDTKEKMEQWCEDRENGMGLVDPDVRIPKIKISSLLKVNGFYLYLMTRATNQLVFSNAVQMKMTPGEAYYVRCLNAVNEKNVIVPNVTKESNLQLYDKLTEKFCTGIYGKRPNPIGEKMQSGREKFQKLELREQIDLLLNVIQLVSHNSGGADLTKIGETKSAGTMKISKNICGRKEIKLIYQSVTGLYEKEVDLLTV